MFNKKEKIAIVLASLELLGFGALAIYSYGKAKFYEGCISRDKELKPIIRAYRNEYDKRKMEDEA